MTVAIQETPLRRVSAAILRPGGALHTHRLVRVDITDETSTVIYHEWETFSLEA